MKRHLVTGLSIALLGCSMMFSGPASAYPQPGYACTPEIEGIHDSVYVGDFNEGYLFVYRCSDSQWQLVDLQYCTFQSGCTGF